MPGLIHIQMAVRHTVDRLLTGHIGVDQQDKLGPIGCGKLARQDDYEQSVQPTDFSVV